MSWEAIGALSEFFGAVAVVGSLVYLARQLRMTRQVDQVATFQAIVNGFTRHCQEFFGAPNDLALRGLKDRDGLTESERLLFDTLLGNVMNHGEMAQGAVQAGLLPEQELDPLDWWLRTMVFRYPGARAWLEESERFYPPAYAARLKKAAEDGAAMDAEST